MTWTKLDDGFWSNPKIEKVGNEAAGVFARALSYCGCHKTDGDVPAGIASYIGKAKPWRALTDIGLVERADEGYFIPDYLKFNPSAEEIRERREMRAAAGRRGGLASAKARSNGSSKRSSKREAKGEASA